MARSGARADAGRVGTEAQLAASGGERRRATWPDPGPVTRASPRPLNHTHRAANEIHQPQPGAIQRA